MLTFMVLARNARPTQTHKVSLIARHIARAANGMIKTRLKFKWFSASFAFVFSSFAILCIYGAGSGDLTYEITSSGLVITNNTARDVYYEVHEETILARIEWAPICKDENRILAKKSVRVSTNFKPSGKVHVFWWHKGKYLMDYDHYGPDEVRSFVIEKR